MSLKPMTFKSLFCHAILSNGNGVMPNRLVSSSISYEIDLHSFRDSL